VLSMIDYKSLPTETWDTAHVREKLTILFVFFEHLHGRPKEEFPIREVLLWKPDRADERTSDWTGNGCETRSFGEKPTFFPNPMVC